MIGQRLWMGIPDPTISDQTRDHLLQVKPGGVILFGRNVVSRSQLIELIENLREILGSSLIVSIDQEGGRVVRIPSGVTLFPGNLSLGAAATRDRRRGLELALLQGQISGMELREIGVDLNLAPCVDLLCSRDGRGIGSRSFGSDPLLLTELATHVGAGHRAQGVHDCWKHFPGIGRATVDPHFDLPRIPDDGTNDGFVPFQAAATAGASVVMTSHVIAEALDRENPVTTSRSAVTDFLRDELQFSGAIVTDCLEMGGVSGFEFEDVIVGAAKAGHDALLVSHTPELQLRALEVLEQLQGADSEFEKEHQESLERLSRLASKIEVKPCQLPDGSEVASEIARAGTTLLGGPVPEIRDTEKWLLVLPELETRSPVEDPLRGEDLSTLVEILGETVDCFEIRSADDVSGKEEIFKRGSEAAGVVMVLQGFRHLPKMRDLVHEVAEKGYRLIIVLLEDPRDLAAVPSGEQVSVMTSFGFRPVHQAAIASALLGQFEFCSQSPVNFS